METEWPEFDRHDITAELADFCFATLPANLQHMLTMCRNEALEVIATGDEGDDMRLGLTCVLYGTCGCLAFILNWMPPERGQRMLVWNFKDTMIRAAVHGLAPEERLQRYEDFHRQSAYVM